MSEMPPVDHVGFQVSDFPSSLTFYTAVLAPLGMMKVMEYNEDNFRGAGLGPAGKPVFWLMAGGKTVPRVHLAFTAPNRAAVDAFYAAALKNGGSDNGPPGVRKEYHPNYYAAFVLDPDGHNIEAVIHVPDRPVRKAATRKGAAKAARKGAAKATRRAAKPAKPGRKAKPAKKPARKKARR
jgi:catechol 2,3-dioxygenase-like lactoylglutathione lyase family enzyme